MLSQELFQASYSSVAHKFLQLEVMRGLTEIDYARMEHTIISVAELVPRIPVRPALGKVVRQ